MDFEKDKYIRDMQSSFERLLKIAKEDFVKWENYPDEMNVDNQKERIANIFSSYTERVIKEIGDVTVYLPSRD